jgi:hypothetical protein
MSDGKQLGEDYDWITCGENEKGQLVQINKKTQEIRELDKWIQIWEEK